ncbi:DTW domain-containing protein 2 [Eurytemora carolleeae]|uniref:DTW domain-containing protein 2 n=1 Tax=Eurytemora carolleeae TaxID=1294199 RepID=UPI000C763D22|nr:DTW domain-containing protein 2 [Eurytemora carolleeae]|eukprot:XP_023341161.1 DTW domain-containing protein 2-like [Eurytemora affinis]
MTEEFLLDICLEHEEDSYDKPVRDTCSDCERPSRVCLCEYISKPRIKLRTSIIILQHPDEEKRAIRTGKLLELGLESDNFKIFRGKKFPGKFPELVKIFQCPGTRLLYPGQDSRVLTEISPPDPNISSIVLLDGTWDQAKKMFIRNQGLQALPKIMLNLSCKSIYTVRTQPNESCLSTLETAVHSVALIEGRSEIIEPLLKPLKVLCNIQLNFGAVIHDSRSNR